MSENRHRIWIVAVVVMGLIAAVFFLVKRGPVEVDGGYQEIMGTFARIVVVANSTCLLYTSPSPRDCS